MYKMNMQGETTQELQLKSVALKDEPPSTDQFKSGFVAIVGRPSVGKSTFLNKVCGENTAITSPLPQTTRSVIRGIVTRKEFQIVFLDTPGIHISEKTLGKHLTKQAQYALSEAEIILYVLDATRLPGSEEINIVEMLKSHTQPIITCINKMDLESPDIVHAHLDLIRTQIKSQVQECYFISSVDGTNTEKLLLGIAEHLPTQPAFYSGEYYTDQSPEFRISEQVRAAALEYLEQEIPHAIYTEVIESSIKHKNAQGEPAHLFVRVQIVVERESQQGIVIGKKGSMIKQIRKNANKRIQPLFDYNVQLELRVAVNKNWKQNKDIISSW